VNYCSNCGSDAIAFKIPEGDHFPRFVCDECGTIHYTNPNMVVGCIIVKDEKIVLARRGIEPRKGYWNLPCGFLENDETIQQGAKREVYEETGLEVELDNLHIVYNLPQANQVYLIFKASISGGKAQLTLESTEIDFFALDAIPWDEIAFSSNSFAIKKYIENGWDDKNTHLGSYFKDKIR
jgi:ADP-ribose pyrophosphatase YjhB (NUDIX family)